MNNGIKAARLLLNLRHDHIAAVQGVSGNKDGHIVVMEYLPGGSLADRMVMPIPFREALRIIKAVCLALQFAHANRITHGNLKPSNVLFTGTDSVKLADFRMNDEREDTGHDDLPLRIRDDIFSIGAMLYTMVLGFPPVFEDNSFVAHKQFKNLPQEVKRLILRLLSSDDAVRFQGMKQVADTITAIYGDERDDDKTVVSLDSKLSSGFSNSGKNVFSRRTFWRNVGIVAVVVLVVVVLGFVFFR
jgi:serine/threonine-protein kinase